MVDMEWYNTYGSIFGIYDCGKPLLYVADPVLIKQILVKDFHTFRNRTQVPGIVSKSMPRASDEDWKRIRAIASPAFTSGKLRHMYPLLNECCLHLLAELDRDVSTSGGHREVDVKHVMSAYTLDGIASTAFAINTNSYSNPNNEFITTANKIANLIFSTNDWHKILAMILPTFLTNNRMWKRMATGGRPADQFFNDVARRVMSERKKSAQKHNDFLQLLMDVEREDDTSDTTTGAGDAMFGHHVNESVDELMAEKQAFSGVLAKKLTADEILAQCSVFFTAGYETTALTLTYCTYELAVNPDIQDRLVAEIRDAFNENTDIDYDTLCRLPLLDAVISETLRKYPTDSR
ncbi:unnamed protein product, partial [Medioppia subpectinata]